MAPNPISLTLESPHLCRLCSPFSSRPISNFSQKSQISLNPVRFTRFKALISCNSCSYPLNSGTSRRFLKDSGWPLNADRICTSAVSGGDSGGAGGLGGSGNGNSSGGGDETDDNSWYLEVFVMFPMIIILKPALLNYLGDLFCQLVIEKAASLDLKRTVNSTSMGVQLVHHTLRNELCFDLEIPPSKRLLIELLLQLVCELLFLIFCFIRILATIYTFELRKRSLENDIKNLSKYKYCNDNRLRPLDDDTTETNLCNEVSLLTEDSDCCICQSGYEEGVELNMLPCKHHFHCECIRRWLRIKPTCPLCKLSIRRGRTLA